MDNNTPIPETDKNQLKQKALPYLPRNLGEIEAHQKILTAISRVVPEVAACIEKADVAIWSKVQSEGLPINRAIAQCAYEANMTIGSAPVSMLQLHGLPEEVLLEAWIALDYYSYVLKADYSVNLRSLQGQIANTLMQPQPVVPEEIPIPVTPVDNYIPATMPIDPVEPQNVSAPKGPIVPPVTPQPVKPVSRAKSKTPMVIAIAAAAVLVLALLISLISGDVRKTERAIEKIGTVTLDSEANILDAEELYNALDSDKQEKVENSETLFASRAEFDALVTDDAINAIGAVTLGSEKAILHAEELYDALSRDARNLVKNYKTLTAARKEHTRLLTAIQTASDAIDAIGTVTLESEESIATARSAYDALKKDNLQDQLAHKVSILNAAEAEYERLVYQDLYDSGVACFGNKDYTTAISYFDNVINGSPDSAMVKNAKESKANAQVELARAAYSKKDYYTATMTLREVDNQYHSLESYQKLNDQLIAALTKNRAANGAAINGSIAWGQCYFKVTAGSQDVCFKFQNTNDPSVYKMVYVRAGQSVKLNVKDGVYSVKWATGEYWYGKDHLFGPDTVYRSDGTVNFTTTREGNWIYYWHLDMDLGEEPNSGSIISANSF